MQSQRRKQVTRGLKRPLLGVGAGLILAVHSAFPEEGHYPGSCRPGWARVLRSRLGRNPLPKALPG
jgi:hypothetical protein